MNRLTKHIEGIEQYMSTEVMVFANNLNVYNLLLFFRVQAFFQP